MLQHVLVHVSLRSQHSVMLIMPFFKTKWEAKAEPLDGRWSSTPMNVSVTRDATIVLLILGHWVLRLMWL